MTQARNQTFPKWVRLHPVGFKAVRPQSSCPLIQQGGMGSAVKPRPQTHVYAFRARKWHPVLTFLVILCNVSWFRLTRGEGCDRTHQTPASTRRLEAFTTDTKIIRLTRRRVAVFFRRRRRGRFSTATATRLISNNSRG